MKRSAIKRGKPLARGTKRLKARKVPKAFRHRRDPAYQAWVRGQPCLLSGRSVAPAGMAASRYYVVPGVKYWHQCWGPVQVCHVKSRGAGGDDRANIVPLCAGGHAQQHTGIQSFQRYWDLDLCAAAARLYQTYLRENGQ